MKAIDGQGESGYYHISSGSDYSIKELFDATVQALGIKLSQPVEVRPRNPDDAYTILLDPSKTNKMFDWKVETPLELCLWIFEQCLGTLRRRSEERRVGKEC